MRRSILLALVLESLQEIADEDDEELPAVCTGRCSFQIVGSNNTGKTTLINPLQFLYLDDRRYMHFGSDTAEQTRAALANLKLEKAGRPCKRLMLDCRLP